MENQFGEISTGSAVVSVVVTCINDLPVITLLGSGSEQILLYSLYVDSGATATDIEDGNLTPSIIVSGYVNTGVVGTYPITYDVTDST